MTRFWEELLNLRNMSYWKFMSKGSSATKKAGKAGSATAGKASQPKKASASASSQAKKEGPVAGGGTGGT